MKVGVWFYGLATALTGILDIAWGDFDPSHQPIKSLGKNIPGQHILAWVAGVWLIAAGLAILWRRSAKIGAAASAIAYLIFAALWLPRYDAGIHALGWRTDVLLLERDHVHDNVGVQIRDPCPKPAVCLFSLAVYGNLLDGVPGPRAADTVMPCPG